MSDTSEMTGQRQEAAIWEGLEAFKEFPDWLAAARDPHLVGAELEQLFPEFTSDQMHLVGCDIGHIRFKSDFWTGIYRVTVSVHGLDQPRTVTLAGKVISPLSHPQPQAVLEGAFGMADFHAVLPSLHLDLRAEEPETVLGALGMLTEPESAQAFLTRAIRAGTPRYRDLQIQACHPRVVRYKPGSRCTIVYHLEYPPEHAGLDQWPDLVVAKTYRGEKGQNAFESMAALWDSPLGKSSTVTISEPLAYEPELKALIQGPIREEYTLKDLIGKAILTGQSELWVEAEVMLRKTAAGLAELHRSGVDFGRLWTWEDELAEVDRWMTRLADPLPELVAAINPLLERLRTLHAMTPPDPVLPSHGTFRPAQVLIHQGNIGFIDFDSFCQSEPSLDLGLFLATIRNIGVTTASAPEIKEGHPDETRARIDRLCEIFLDEYGSRVPFSCRRLALWETLDIFTYVIHCWTKIKTGEVESTVLLLESYLQGNDLVRRG